MTLHRSDWLLLFIGLPEGKFKTDQLRITKGMFLFVQECKALDPSLYDFKPYDYGPFAPDIYADLDLLEAQGFIRHIEQPGGVTPVEWTAEGLRLTVLSSDSFRS